MKHVHEDKADHRIPTPELVNVIGCVEYDETAEKAFEARQRDLHSERTVMAPTPKKRRRRRRGRTNWTRPKRSKSSMRWAASSTYSHDYDDTRSLVSYSIPPSPYSNVSEYSYRHNGTRSNVSSVMLHDWERPQTDLWYETGYYCTERGCQKWFTNVDTLTDHKIQEHMMRDLFYCIECNNRYTSKSDLIIHAAIHDKVSIFCSMCGEEFINAILLQRHIDRHLIYSISCDYCDLMFLTKKTRGLHQRKVHRYNRVPKEPLPKFIFKQVTYRKFDSNGIFPKNNQAARVNGKKNDIGFCNNYFILSKKVLNSQMPETMPDLCTYTRTDSR